MPRGASLAVYHGLIIPNSAANRAEVTVSGGGREKFRALLSLTTLIFGRLIVCTILYIQKVYVARKWPVEHIMAQNQM